MKFGSPCVEESERVRDAPKCPVLPYCSRQCSAMLTRGDCTLFAGAVLLACVRLQAASLQASSMAVHLTCASWWVKAWTLDTYQ